MNKLVPQFRYLTWIMALLTPLTVQADISVVNLQTSHGRITLELYPDDAPITVDNFLSYVNRGFYDGLIFHRVIENFMIQAGAYDADFYDFLAGDPNFSDPGWLYDPLYYHEPNDPIVNESDNGLKNVRGTIAMARTSAPDSATSQFFINQLDNPHLDATSGRNGYAVFGRVIEGMDVVDTIAQLPTQYVHSSFEDLPVDPVVINQATLVLSFSSTSGDFREVDFLGAQDGSVRTYLGQGSFSGQSYTQSFSPETYLNVACLRWRQTAEPNRNVDQFDLLLARDDRGFIWVFQYELNDDTLVDANSPAQFVPLSALTNTMHFRLLSGNFNPSNLADPNNILVREENGATITEQIIAFNESLPRLPYYSNELILVEQTRLVDPNDITWRYYHASVGLVLDLCDDSGAPDGDGWRLGWYGESQPSFRSGSDDFRDVPFINAEPADLRIYLGQGSFTGSSFDITCATQERLGVKCLKITESPVDSIRPEGTKLLARDQSGGLWLFERTTAGLIDFSAAYIDQIVPLKKANDMHLLLMTGVAVETGTSITVGDGPDVETEEIISLNESLERFPDFDNQLMLVKWFQQGHEDLAQWQYFHETTALMQQVASNIVDPNLPDPNGDGWYLREPQQMQDVVIVLKVGKTPLPPSDYFKVGGQFAATPDDFSGRELEFRVGPYRLTIDTDDPGFTKSTPVENVYLYKGTPDGTARIVALMDLRRGRFIISARRVNLTGLNSPVKVELRAGDYYGAALASVKAGQDTPLRFMRGEEDILRLHSFRFVYDDGPNAYWSYGLTVVGDIATDFYPLSLAGKEITIIWGQSTFTIPAGVNGLKQQGRREKFIYKNPGQNLRLAYFDLENCKFRVVIAQAHLNRLPQNLSIRFEKDDDTYFQQSISVP